MMGDVEAPEAPIKRGAAAPLAPPPREQEARAGAAASARGGFAAAGNPRLFPREPWRKRRAGLLGARARRRRRASLAATPTFFELERNPAERASHQRTTVNKDEL